ncbi:MAG: ATP-binding cassette domain-containing protein [Methanomassiliicoccales archaeon]|jgi:lipooligosaccharide transport system ATP-binding protein|nr:ATP-binding cassette domain-containing protein [Methanomassiliicoccales archaeon]
MDWVIEAEALTKKFEDLVAVDGISFRIAQGECFGFLGPNGAGKTTAIRMIQCVSPVTSGKLTVLGMDVGGRQREIKALLGVCPQEDNLDPDFTAWKNLLVYARYFGIRREEAEKRAKDLLEFMQLTEKKDVEIPKLSGGMKRRLVIARALMNDPKLLILDEPTTGLDPQARHLIWDKVRELRKRGVTVLITTHYMDEAQQLCERLVIMEKGRILVEGVPADLISRSVGSGVVEVLSPTDGMDAWLRKGEWIYEKAGDRAYLYTDDNRSLRERILREFPAANVIIRDATLEDVFLKLTGRGLRD